jgi:O-antigen ligase
VRKKQSVQATGEFTLKLRDWRGRWSDRVVALFSFLLPLCVVIGAKDTFRTPKDALFRAEAIVLASLYVGSAIIRAPKRWNFEWRTPHMLLPVIIVGWTAITTLTSTNRARSVDALVTVCAAVVVYFATIAFARRRGFKTLFFIIIPAAINAILGALQEFNVWQPFLSQESVTHHQRSSALIGNPNDAGGYLAAVALASVAAAASTRQYRTAFTGAAILLTIGLLINQTLTAIVAFAAGALLLAAMRSWRNASRGALLALLVLMLAVISYSPLRRRAVNLRSWLMEGNFNAALTNRGAAFITATMMARDHPILGVGPRCFAWQYFPYKLEAEKRFPSLRASSTRGNNFGEVHNDHLQVLAETGAIGYAIFLATIVALAMMSIQRRPDAGATERRAFTRMLALPLAFEFVVLALAQFPLELTAVLSQFIFLAALCAAWIDG